nr:acetate--CoA ligase family protein [Anaerolineae bacterium]
MDASDLNVFFRPKGVAVIGASRIPGKLGYGVVNNLIEHRYNGPIYPVNPGADKILGQPAFASIQDVPNPLDLAVIVVPAAAVAGELEACGQRGVKSVIIISGGFREIGPEGAEREEQIKAIASRYRIAVLGPNCIGTIDTHTPLNTTFVTGIPNPGHIALVSQSGAIAAALIDWARGAGVGFSRIVSLGNETCITEADMLVAIAQDERTEVITAYIEGVSDGRTFLDVASAIARERPIIALKVGRSSSAMKAVASHTGALAGSEAAYNAAFHRAGVLRADKLEEMLDWARALAWQPLPRGNRVGILTNAGGPGIMALDALESYGMQLAPLSPETKTYLKKRVPAAASVGNPVDVLAGSGPATYALCLDALLADETVDAVVVIAAPQDWFAPVSLAEVVGEVGNSQLGRRKPILAAIMGLASTSDATQVLHRRRIPNFAFPERVGSTLGAMWQRKQWLDSLDTEEKLADRPTPDRAAARAIITGYRGWLPDAPRDALLNAYSIPIPPAGLAHDGKDAVRLAEEIGYPVAVKLSASRLTHKSDLGGVALDIRDETGLQAAITAMEEQVARFQASGQDIGTVEGFTVQRMEDGQVELIVGAVRDTQFGPLVMAGLGGTLVELRGDVAFALAPLSRQQADDLLDRTHAGRLLDGYRGNEPADREAAIDVILKLSQAAVDFPDIAEIEINPLIVKGKGEGATAVDTRIRVTPQDG